MSFMMSGDRGLLFSRVSDMRTTEQVVLASNENLCWCGSFRRWSIVLLHLKWLISCSLVDMRKITVR